MRRSSPTGGVRGFTIVELMVALAIVMVLVGAAYQFFIRQQRTYSGQDQLSRIQQQARTAEDFLVRAIQQTGAYSPQTGATISMRGQPILAASDHYVTIQYDDPYRTADAGIITSEEVVTFAVASENPKSATGTNDRVQEASGTNTVGVYYDQDGTDGVEADERFALSIPLKIKGPPYTLYRITPDSADPTNTAKLHADPIATGIENLVFRYYDQNGAPVLRYPTGGMAPGAALPAPYVLNATQRSQIRSVEIELTIRAPAPDPSYSSPMIHVQDNTVATYDANGTPRTGVYVVNDHYRRRIFRTRVIPRNLTANTCGTITLYASNAQPACPDSATITAVVQDRFGAPVPNTVVTFSSSGVGTLTPGSATTNAGGSATTTLSYTGPSTSIPVSASAVIDCSPVGPANFTLVNALGVNFVPGTARSVTVSAPSTTTLGTCPTPAAFTFTAQAFDSCGNVVPPGTPALEFEAVDAAGNPFGTVTPAQFTASGQTFTVTLPTTGPYTAPRDASGNFPLTVRPKAPYPSWGSPPAPITVPGPFTVSVVPSPASRLVGPASWNVAAAAHTDCPSGTVSDTFWLADCLGNVILNDIALTHDPIVAAVQPDPHPSAPTAADSQGTLSLSGPSPSWAFTATYTPPTCTLDPSRAASVSPWYTITMGSSTLTSPRFTLSACLQNVSVTANPATMSECQGQTTVSLSGCNLHGRQVELWVTTTRGSGTASFNSTPNSTVDHATVTLAGNSPSTAQRTLYVGTVTNGSEVVVTAYFPNRAGALWQASSAPIPVRRQCNALEIYSDSALTRIVGNGVGNESCLSRLSRLYFKVEDCQSAPTTLANAVTVYAIGENGTWVDRETVSLSEDPSGAAKPLFFSSRRTGGTNGLPGLLLAESSAYVRGDGTLHYPVGKAVELLAVYEDPLDATDPGTTPFLRLGTTTTLPVSLTARCQKLVSLAIPLPVCFPNAITSGGGGTWNGNFRVHWGDVVIRGSADPSNAAKRIAKDSSAALDGSRYSGSGNSDRFFDIYVGYADPAHTAGGNYVGQPSSFQPLQPLGYGNYFGNISYAKITDMMAELDYDTMKTLAKQRGAYWYTLAGTTTIRNPATGQQAGFETVLHLPGGPGTRNAYYDGKFIFVDTFAAADPGPTLSGAALNAALDASLGSAPYFTLGNVYTEGIIYIAGSVDYRSGGGGANITVKTPPALETRYDHNTAGAMTEADLPIRSRPPQPQLTVALSGININGGVYMKGEALFSGSPMIFGSLSAERGFGGSGTPEIWYNYNLNVDTSDTGLCVECCSAEIQPQTAEIDVGQTVQLNGFYTNGGLSWGSETPSVASVDTNGLVRGLAEGTARIKLVDGNNCPAWSTITVRPACSSFSVSPATATVASGGTHTFQVLKPGANVTWTVAGPATTVSATTTAITLRGDVVAAPTNVTVTARDVNTGCAATATLTVNTATCTLAVTPATVTVTKGSSTVLSVATTNLGTVSWSAGSGAATVTTPGIISTVAGVTPRQTVAVTAVDDFFSGGTCTAIANVTVACAMPASVTHAVHLGGTVTLTATGGVGPYTWSPSSNASHADYSPAPGTGATAIVVGSKKNKSATFTVTDSEGCRTTFTVNVGN